MHPAARASAASARGGVLNFSILGWITFVTKLKHACFSPPSAPNGPPPPYPARVSLTLSTSARGGRFRAKAPNRDVTDIGDPISAHVPRSSPQPTPLHTKEGVDPLECLIAPNLTRSTFSRSRSHTPPTKCRERPRARSPAPRSPRYNKIAISPRPNRPLPQAQRKKSRGLSQKFRRFTCSSKHPFSSQTRPSHLKVARPSCVTVVTDDHLAPSTSPPAAPMWLP